MAPSLEGLPGQCGLISPSGLRLGFDGDKDGDDEGGDDDGGDDRASMITVLVEMVMMIVEAVICSWY